MKKRKSISFDLFRRRRILMSLDLRVHYWTNLPSQTCAYAHQIAFTWCNPREIHVEARLNKSNRAIRICMMAIWSVQQDSRISGNPIAHADWLYGKRRFLSRCVLQITQASKPNNDPVTCSSLRAEATSSWRRPSD